MHPHVVPTLRALSATVVGVSLLVSCSSAEVKPSEPTRTTTPSTSLPTPPSTEPPQSGFGYMGPTDAEIPTLSTHDTIVFAAFSEVVLTGSWSGASQTQNADEIKCTRSKTGSDSPDRLTYEVRTSPFDLTDSGSDDPGRDYVLTFSTLVPSPESANAARESYMSLLISNPHLGEPNPKFGASSTANESFTVVLSPDLKDASFSVKVDSSQISGRSPESQSVGIAGRVHCNTIAGS